MVGNLRPKSHATGAAAAITDTQQIQCSTSIPVEVTSAKELGNLRPKSHGDATGAIPLIIVAAPNAGIAAASGSSPSKESTAKLNLT